MDVVCHFCEAFHWIDERITTSSILQPEFGMCCDHGKVSLPPLRIPPLPLFNLFTGTSMTAREFQTNIVQYNAALAFTSMGVNIDHSVLGRGPPVFRIHGELTHLTGSLLPEEGVPPTYAQLYIHDSQDAYRCRITRNDNLSLNTLNSLQQIMKVYNAYTPLYQHAYEILRHYDAPDYSIKLCVLPEKDHRRYNLPTADEVGVILPGENSYCGDYRDIILHLRPRYYHRSDNEGKRVKLQRINEGHAGYAPLHYVLFFPYGEAGWYQGLMVEGNHRRITLLQYTAYRIHCRNHEFSSILRGRRLFQTYLVDMFACIDQERLHFIRTQQPKLRVTFLNGLEDALSENDDNLNLSQIGQRVILPASYRGGPRDMYQRYLDGMAIARHFKKIDIFLTMTANPTWLEITRELLPGQTAIDRPDLVTRVFHLKMKALINAILQDGIFGHCVAHIYAIEFQKRGLPHMHLLLFLDHKYKLLTPDIIDTVISARWPNPNTHPRLFECVKKFMVHGPCGLLNPNAPCMKNGKCIHGFPKPFEDRTTVDHNGYPHYLRPNDGRTFQVGHFHFDNRWIIPYNPFCLLWLYCHINVECAIFFGSLKYINKYIDKGGDCSTLSLQNDRDEVKQYIDGRYFSASEAVWRILQFKLHGQQPNVVRLPFHLPHEQRIIFNPSSNVNQIVEYAENNDTALTAFFEMNKNEEHPGDIARTLTYQDFPSKFVLKNNPNNQQSKIWSLRQRKPSALGRLMYVGPTAGERFYLRTLLMVLKGPKSFDDLRTINGRLCDTFHDACQSLGLLEDDGEWRICLQDAAEIKTGAQLRHLFVTILLFCTPMQPNELWMQFRHLICDDLEYNLRQLGRTTISNEDIYDFGLHLIDQILHDSGHTLSDIPSMPHPIHNWDRTLRNRLITQQLNFDSEAENSLAYSQLNSLTNDQRFAFDRIWQSIIGREGRMFFIDGFGGTGKTYLYQTITHAIRAQNMIVLCVASTGLACLLLPGGQTAHSMFKIPIDTLDCDSICNIPKESIRADLLRIAQAVVYDECLMTHKHCFEALDRTLQDLRNCSKPFGGITMIFGGDFQQILPVVSKGSRADIVNASLLKSYLWNKMEILKLRENMRLQRSPTQRFFSNWLLDIGHGRNNDKDDSVDIPQSMVLTTEEDLIEAIYGDISKDDSPPPPHYFLDHAILAPTNIDVQETNQKILDKMPGNEITYHSADSIECDSLSSNSNGYDDFPQDFLRSLNPSSLPLADLKIKIGCPVMLLRNLDPNKGLCNGTRLIIIHAYRHLLEVMIIGGDHDGEKAFIPRITLKPTSHDYPFTLKRRQFPIRLSFAMTINKAQGQSLKYVGIHLLSPVFCHGQLYVALSRVTSCEHIHILLDKNKGNKTTNIVYQEVLLH